MSKTNLQTLAIGVMLFGGLIAMIFMTMYYGEVTGWGQNYRTYRNFGDIGILIMIIGFVGLLITTFMPKKQD